MLRGRRATISVSALTVMWAFAGQLSCSDDSEAPGPGAAGDTGAAADLDAAPTDSTDDDAGEVGEAPLVVYTEEREPCTDRNPLRNLYWGDVHVHTALSFDAYANELRVGIDEAHAFARGAPVQLPPLDDEGRGTQTLTIDRPLDFVAITDHAEFLAEVRACSTPESPAYDTPACREYRVGGDDAVALFGIILTQITPRRIHDICEESELDCAVGTREVWAEIQASVERAYDRSSACQLSAFVAYEWSGATRITNLHRNVIFRNDIVPDAPTSYIDQPTPLGLWRELEESCANAGTGCEVLAIPHNSNWSNGNLFAPTYSDEDSFEEQVAQARLRAEMEPLVEIFQHKGGSECRNGLSGVLGEPDELCDFELLRERIIDDCHDGVGAGAMAGFGCTSRNDFVRFALLTGMQEEARLGVNPYQTGIIASTDTHNAIPGAVSETNYLGHTGLQEDTPEERLGEEGLVPGGVINNPGGLMAAWSVENSRDALFETMRRRETYGTSGPRIALRFFGGWRYAADLCDQPDLVEQGYARGVPMGGTLSSPPEGNQAAPVFVVSALRDPGTADQPGMLLQRVQIIKGWIDGEGERRVEVFEVAGDGDNGATVDTTTCQTSGSGFDTLCGVWTDPDFDPAQRSYYYARVVENPICRWSTALCVSLEADERPESCDDPEVGERIIQERAWSSPIWYLPE